MFGVTHQLANNEFVACDTLNEAANLAAQMSKLLPVKVEVRDLSLGYLGASVAAFQSGQFSVEYQLNLFGGKPTKGEEKFLNEMGRLWWKTLGYINQAINGYSHRLTVLTPDERYTLRGMEMLKKTMLLRLERDLTGFEYEAAKWKFVDSVIYRNHVVPLPETLHHRADATIRKDYHSAFTKTGATVIREKWPLPDEHNFNYIQHFFGVSEDTTSTDNEGKFVAESSTRVQQIR
jgi:hypothetical protein